MVALEISAIAVLSPVLLAVGILHILSAANLGATGLFLNGLTAAVGTVRYTVDLPEPLSGALAALFILSLMLAMTVNARLFGRFWTSLTAPPPPIVRPKPARRQAYPPALAQPPPRPKPAASTAKKRVQIVSSRAWVLHNAGDIRVFSVPPAIAEKNKEVPASDQTFRILDGEDQDILEDTYTVSQNLQILFPPEVIEKLQASPLIRFEIGEPSA